MKLEEFKELQLQSNTIIEYQRKDEEHVRAVRLGYFQRLVEELPDEWKRGHPEPPFVEIAHSKDKNGVPCDLKEYNLDDILFVYPKGKSNFVWKNET